MKQNLLHWIFSRQDFCYFCQVMKHQSRHDLFLSHVRPDLKICWFAVTQPGLQETCRSKKNF